MKAFTIGTIAIICASNFATTIGIKTTNSADSSETTASQEATITPEECKENFNKAEQFYLDNKDTYDAASKEL